MSATAEIEVDGHRLSLSSLDKPMWPAAGLTKGDLIEYYRRVAPALVPHLVGRALTLARFPDGIDGRGFGQTECRGRPEWMATAPLKLRSGVVRHYCVVNDTASLVWVANLGTIELHPFLARAGRPEEPTAVVFDLDPGPGAGLLGACAAGLRVRDVLRDEHGLLAFPKTSGGSGLHVLVPLNTPHSFAETKAFARAVASRLRAEDPGRMTDEARRSARAGGRVLVDWVQNEARRSTVAPYSLRAADWPVVSTPVTWEEVEEAVRQGRPNRLVFTPGEVLRRIEERGDVFAGALEVQQRLPGPTGTSAGRGAAT